MRKQKLANRLLSVALSVAMVMSSGNSAGMMDAKADTVSEAVSENGVLQDDEMMPSSDESMGNEEVPLDEDGVSAKGEGQEQEGQEEGEQEQNDREQEDEKKQKQTEDAAWDDALEAEQAIEPDTKVSELITGNPALLDALLWMYNTEKGEAALNGIDELTYNHLQDIERIDFTAYDKADDARYKAAEITDIKGLGYVGAEEEGKLSYLDISATNITVIGENEFKGHKKLETVIVSDSLEGLGRQAFSDCISLKTFQSVGKTGEDTAVSGNSIPSSLIDSKTNTEIFKGCESLEEMTIDCKKSGALQNAGSMFEGCTGLKNITIGAGVTVLPPKMFMNAGYYHETENPDGMTVTVAEGSQLNKILSQVFQKANMSSLDLSNCKQLTEIGELAFTYMSPISLDATPKKENISSVPLKELVLPAQEGKTGMMTIGENAFFRTQICKMYVDGETPEEGYIHIPDYVTSVGQGSFYGNEEMKSLSLSSALEGIKGYLFYGCKNLEDVTVSTDSQGSSAIGYINDAAFYGTQSLRDGDFLADMNQLKVIGEKDLGTIVDTSVATENYLTKYIEGDDIKQKVASNVFLGSGLETVTFPASLRKIMSRAFYSCGALTDVVWKTDTSLENGAEFIIASEAFVSIVGKPSKDSLSSTLERFYYPATEGHGAKFTIGKNAFSECGELTEFKKTDETTNTANTLPATLVSLGDDAFSKCSALPNIHIKNNENKAAPELGENAFMNCKQLAEAELPSALTEVPKQFFYDAALTEFPIFENNVNAIEKINEAAFFGNKFETLDLSGLKKLAEIGNYAFAHLMPDGSTVKWSDEFEARNVPLKTVIMPMDRDSMKLGDYIFWSASKLDTMMVGTVGTDGEALIPDYIANNQCGSGLFNDTGVSVAKWQSDTTGKNKWSVIPGGMFGASQVARLSDACLSATDLKEIGAGAYFGLDKLTELDLTPYQNLGTMGSEVFANCFNLESVKLPNNDTFKKVPDDAFHIGSTESLILSGSAYSYKSSLKSIDFGSAVELGKNCFAAFHSKDVKDIFGFGIDVIKAGDLVDPTGERTTLAEISFAGSKVTKIGTGAFRGQTSLEKAQFDGVAEIGDNAFMQCTKLNLTNMPIADSVEKIGASAFEKDSAIGKVKFGGGLKSIGAKAFFECAEMEEIDKVKTMVDNSGLTELDFTSAQNLTEIGENAFNTTAIKDFELTSPVSKLKKGVVGNCLYLQKIDLGEGVSSVEADAAFGCIGLKDVEFFSTTTMDQKAFNSQTSYKRQAEGNTTYTQYTPVNKIGFVVKPVDVVLAKGRCTKFPYFVNKYDSTSTLRFKEMHIGDAANQDQGIYKYVKVVADTDGYYVNDTKEDYRIQNVAGENYSNYYSPVEAPNDMIYTTDIGVKVVTFDIYGLEATSSPIPFTITNSFNFQMGGDDVPCLLSPTFYLTIKDIPYRAVLYNDQKRTEAAAVNYDPVTGLTTVNREVRLNKSNTNGKMTFYYDIQNIGNSDSRPDNCNLIVKVSNPDVVTVTGSTGSKLVEGTKDTWLVPALPYSGNVTTSYQATNNKFFAITPKKCGNATVTVYPEGCPQKTTVINLHTLSDINRITLSAPTEYRDGYKPGDSFHVIDTVSFYLGQSVSRKAETIGKISEYTDNRITFTSSKPEVMSVDAQGNVTVRSVTTTKTEVIITATAAVSGGESVTSTLKCSVAYPPLKSGAQETDMQTGAQVQVTALPKGTEPGAVTYVKPGAGVKNVVIPDTMTINGTTCKVTKIDAAAFKGNKTITTVKIGNNITEIPVSAFEGCSNLTSVTIPKKVTMIADKAFYNCKKLKTVSLVASGALTTIGNQAFAKCTALTKITIPKNVTKLGTKAFYGCSKLKTVTINAKAKLMEIGSSAFEGCKVMTKITIPANVTTIRAKAFYKCAKLKTITVKSSKLKTVEKNAFKGIHKKASIKVPRKKLNDYKILLKGKGQAKTVKIKK